MDDLSQINQNNALINNEDVINSALPSENEIISRQNIYDYNQNNNEEQNNFKLNHQFQKEIIHSI